MPCDHGLSCGECFLCPTPKKKAEGLEILLKTGGEDGAKTLLVLNVQRLWVLVLFGSIIIIGGFKMAKKTNWSVWLLLAAVVGGGWWWFKNRKTS